MGTREISRFIEGSVERNCGGAGYSTFRVLGDGTNIDFLDPFLQLDEIKRRFKERDAVPLPWTPYVGMVRLLYVVGGGTQWTGRHPEKGDKQGYTDKGDLFALHGRSGALLEETVSEELYRNGGYFHAFEIWVKEPEVYLQSEPLIDTYSAHELPKSEGDGWTARVIYGTFSTDGTEQPAVETTSPCNVIDFAIFGGKTMEYTVPDGWNAAVYIYEGEAELQSNMQIVGEGAFCVFERKGTSIEIWAKGGDAGAITRCLLLCGRALREPMERNGSIVCSYDYEIQDAQMNPHFREAVHNLQILKAQPNEQGVRISYSDLMTPRVPAPQTTATHHVPTSSAADLKEKDLQARLHNLTMLKNQGTPGLELAIQSTKKELSDLQAGKKKKSSSSSPSLHGTLDEDMARYDAKWKQYAAKWTTYLQQLHAKILQNPNDVALRDQYKTKHAEYSKQLDVYNKKVETYNHNKAQQRNAIRTQQALQEGPLSGRPQGQLDLILEDR
eukprot:TRINITY_DN19046_c0_g1_i1.p1 TRINITY_DN19046_c0_g1~~TRINITY_DN19046_c0_g1_i1.p1  ORF type:complete len:499 (+),score=92.89 TRINITY_DN19046_c0_g1_i1:63-1559(+)